MSQRPTRSNHNLRWTTEDVERLLDLLDSGAALGAIAVKLNRSYAAVEKRIWKLGKGGTAPTLSPSPKRSFRRPPMQEATTNLTCLTIDPGALPIIHELYDRIVAHRAATIAKTYSYRKLKPRIEGVIAAIVRDLLLLHFHPGTTDWIRVSTRQARSSEIGVNEDIVRNLLDALKENGFIERLNGYENLMGRNSAAVARGGRATRIRGTSKLFDLCAKYGLTRERLKTWFT
jgi:hypothetical protein